MPPPARLRDQYVVGQTGSYLAATVKACDQHLDTLRVKLAGSCGAPRARILHDLDALLDRRRQLQRETR